MLHKLTLIILLTLSVGYSSAQQDTLRIDDPRVLADTIFGKLDTTLYGGRLLNRSLSSSIAVQQQVYNDYSQIHNIASWLEVYQAIELSYTDTTKITDTREMVQKLLSFYYDVEINSDDFIVPLGLIYQNVKLIDTNKFNSSHFTVNNSQLIPIGNESLMYEDKLIKSAAILDMSDNSGYSAGLIKYDTNFIAISDDFDLQEVYLNVGGGFQRFSIGESIEFSRSADSLLGQVALVFYKNDELYQDTIDFYLTSGVSETAKSGLAKASDRWDEKFTKDYYPDTDLKYRVAIKYGCGNDNKIRRPIIFVPPYRPSGQVIRMEKYYDQFGFKSLFHHLSNMGYDVIYIKEKPGNLGIAYSGRELAYFIWAINIEKKLNYPNEDWENVLVGFSAGGQHARYALMYMEDMHMSNGLPHHHTRLYIPFDSPHHGANVPMMTQAVYYEMDRTGNIWGMLAYNALIDDASKGMLRNHIIGGQILNNNGWNVYTIHHAPTAERVGLLSQFNNDFQNIYTPTGPNDQRKIFPTFTRNIAVSTGSNEENYTTAFGLNPGMEVFSQDLVFPAYWGVKIFKRNMYASKYSSSQTSFNRKDLNLVGLLIPVINERKYITNYLPEFDMAQGGYKNEFYDKTPFVAIDPVGILRASAGYFGQQHYKSHMSFLPLVSSLALNPDIWQNNNLFYDLKDGGLMYQNEQDVIDDNNSELYGYPHLAHPNDHFDITPFEAVFADQLTYEHIKMQKSVDENNLNDVNLVYLRNFIVDEVEGTVVALQNKTIGQNHINWDPNFKYKAWYKAEKEIIIGNKVTPKTDPGDFIIENSGEITVYAGERITIKPGFHAKEGSYYHSYIYWDGCGAFSSNIPTDNGSNSESLKNEVKTNEDKTLSDEKPTNVDEFVTEKEITMHVYPNPSQREFTVEVVGKHPEGTISVLDVYGKLVYHQKCTQNKTIINQEFQSGLYIIKWSNKETTINKKIIVL